MSREIKQKYDELLSKLQKQQNNNIGFPYINEKGKEYSVYFQREYLNYLKNKMSEADKKAYEKGAGGELKENPNAGKPPKMLSVASSSRFCFLSLKGSDLKAFRIDKQEGSIIEFEKKLPILERGTPPHMDAFYDSKYCNIYFECKCHEMFDNHFIELSKNYFNGDLLCSRIDKDYCKEKDNKFIVQPSYFFSKDNCLTFDVKQLLTHLMGIKANKKIDRRARLIYYYFIPNVEYEESIQFQIDKLYSEANEIFYCNLVQSFINENNIKIELYVQNSMVVQTATKENTILILDSSMY